MYSEDETIWKSWFLVLFISIWPSWTYFGPILGQFWITYGPNLGFNTKCTNFHMKINALFFKWSGKMELTDSVDKIVCFWPFCANFGPNRPNSGPKCPNMTLSSQFLKCSCKICTQRMKLFERVDLWSFLYSFDNLGPILDQFWVSFGLLMDQIWASIPNKWILT